LINYKKIAIWLVFSVLLFAALRFAAIKHGNQVMKFPEIVIDASSGNAFLMQKDVENRLKNKDIILNNIKKSEINAALVESVLSEMHEVQSAEVHVNIDDTWSLDLVLRKPIARIFNEKGESFYLDDKGRVMPLSSLYTANAIPFSGAIRDRYTDLSVQEIINNDSLKTKSLLPKVYYLSQYVCNNAFLSSLITQVVVDEHGDFVLIPLVGNHKIIFGIPSSPEVVEERFKKLEIFYYEALPFAGWSAYETINLKYKNQVVCKKR
jgi:cell division protein FtsQ